jgi:hypothetical protein
MSNTTFVPAITPMTLWEVGVAGDEELLVRTFPIVAWRVYADGGAPRPVAIGCEEADFHHNPGECPFFIELPDGGGFRHAGYMGGLFGNLGQCTTSVITARARQLASLDEAAD